MFLAVIRQPINVMEPPEKSRTFWWTAKASVR